MATQEYKIKVEYGVSAIVLLIGAFFIFQAFTIETSREAVGPPAADLAVALVLGGLWLAIRASPAGRDRRKDTGSRERCEAHRMVVGCGVLFVFMFWGFGYFAAIIATYVSMLYTFGVRDKRWMIGGAVVLALIFQWLFIGIMLLNDPAGAILNLRPYTNWITGA